MSFTITVTTMYASIVVTALLVAHTKAQSLFEVLVGNPDLSSLVALLNNSAIVGDNTASAFASATNITFLAPNNAAIRAFTNSSTAAALGSDSQLISAILGYFITPSST